MDRWIDGFDHYAAADMGKVYTSAVFPQIGSPGRFYGGQFMNLTLANSCATTLTLDNQPRWTVGFALRCNHAPLPPSDGGDILNIKDGTTTQVTIAVDNNNRVLKVVRNNVSGGTTLGLGTTILQVGTWYYVELNVVINTTGSGSFELRINGITEASGTNVNTRQSANNQANGFVFRYVAPTTTETVSIDDLYIRDGQTGSTGFMGEVAVRTIRPTSNGTYSQWTPSAGSNYQCVDDTTFNGDTDYVSSATPDNKDTYKFPFAYSSTIRAVAYNVISRKDDAGTRTFKAMFRAGDGTERLGTEKTVLDSYSQQQQIWSVNPVTTSTWLASEVDAGEFGKQQIV